MKEFKVWASETVVYEEKYIEAETYEEAEEIYNDMFGTADEPQRVDNNMPEIESEE
jgi:hypothetical protein